MKEECAVQAATGREEKKKRAGHKPDYCTDPTDEEDRRKKGRGGGGELVKEGRAGKLR